MSVCYSIAWISHSLLILSTVDGHLSSSSLGLSWMVLLWTLLFRSSDAPLCTFFCLLVLFSRSVLSGSLQPHGHTRLPCPSPSPRACSTSCPLTQWCHPAIPFSVVPFSSCTQSFPASGSFQMSQLFASGGQSIGASDSASVPPMNIRGWSPLGWTGWTLQSKGLSRVFSSTTVQKHWFFGSHWFFGAL